MTRLLALILCASSLTAQAQWLETPYRLFFSGGAAARSRTQTTTLRDGSERDDAIIGLVSPTNLHLSGAVFPHRFFGVDVEGRGEFFNACCDPRLPGGSVAQPGAEASVAALGRALPASWLGLEFHLGVQWLLRSVVDTDLTNLSGQSVRSFFGPMFAAAVVIAPARAFQAMVFVRFSPAFSTNMFGLSLAVGVQASIAAVRLGPVQVGLGPTVELSMGGATLGDGIGARHFNQGDLRFGLGITLQRWTEERVDTPPARPKPVSGRVVSVDGAAAVDVKVTLDGATSTTTDLNGRFTFAEVTAGAHRLEATKENVTPATAEVTAPVDSEVVLTLGPPTGPGRITGVVKQPAGALAGATISTVGEPGVTVKSAADGSYALEKVGPGPVTVRVKADEFNDAEEVAQVAPGGVAELDFVMTPKAVAVKATLRGLIRAKNGEAVKATVRVVELKMKLQVKGDGRFSAEVPSGKYTLIIEARGYVTQNKTVEVSGGDQAIFHTELERTR